MYHTVYPSLKEPPFLLTSPEVVALVWGSALVSGYFIAFLVNVLFPA